MPFLSPTFAQIRDDLLRDLVSQIQDAPIGADSDWRLRANATAAALDGLYYQQSWLARQIFPDTADSDFLVRHASLRGLYRRAATQADGSVTVTGDVGVTLPSGAELTDALTEQTYLSTAAVTLIGTSASVPVRAVAAGIAGNAAVGTELTITNPPADLEAAAIVASLTGGTDEESDAQLLARLLLYLQTPPAGGSQADYLHWAYSIPGVSQAWCYPLRRGAGTVDVAIWADGAPSASTLAAVTAYIAARKPVTADVGVMMPQAVPVVITATLILSTGADLTLIRTSAALNLAGYFAELQPGDTLYRAMIDAVLRDQPGVENLTLVAPSADVATDLDDVELATLGAITLVAA